MADPRSDAPRSGPPLPADFRIPERRPAPKRESPLPPEWSKGAEPLRKAMREEWTLPPKRHKDNLKLLPVID